MPRTPRFPLRSVRMLSSSLALAAGMSLLPVTMRAQEADTSVGIPVTNSTVADYCGDCHTMDAAGRMSRISYLRKTPEGWQTSIRRMVSLNDVDIDPAAAREIVRYLSNRHGLAPEEARPGRFEVERRMVDYRYEADEETETTCKQCHSLGRVITQRRTKEEWELLIATHRGLYPFSDFQAFRRRGPPDDDQDSRHPMEKAIAHLSRAFPLETPEWTAWSANMRPARLQGTWLLTGHDPGAGPVFGTVTIQGDPGDEFTTTIRMTYPNRGRTVTRTGQAIVYTGFQWRGRSFEGSDQATALREVMFVERGWREMSGRWFRGAYDELGVDVTLQRIGTDPVLAGVYPVSVQTGSTQAVTLYGANLPGDISAADVDLGPGIEVIGVTDRTGDRMTVRVRVAADASVGARDVFVGPVTRTGAIAVYDEIQRITVSPVAGMARVGGANFPKQIAQFEAIAHHNGADGEPDTDDDIDLGRVDVDWSLTEYTVTYDDDDVDFVGSIDDNGLFTPALDGPNPNRSRNRNNVGDVWVVATLNRPDHDGRPLRARAHLLVTVPLYIRFDPWRATP